MCPNAFKVFGFGNFFVQGVWASVFRNTCAVANLLEAYP